MFKRLLCLACISAFAQIEKTANKIDIRVKNLPEAQAAFDALQKEDATLKKAIDDLRNDVKWDYHANKTLNEFSATARVGGNSIDMRLTIDPTAEATTTAKADPAKKS